MERNSTSVAAESGTTTPEIRGAVVNPSAKGARSEAAILSALVALGKAVLMPWGASQRYDFVLDEGDGRFVRVQCKTGVLHDGQFIFGRPVRTVEGQWVIRTSDK